MNWLLDRRLGASFLLCALAWMPQALSAASKPIISGYTPAPTVSLVDYQTITVYGSAFQRGLTVKLTEPTGRSSVLSASRVSQVSANSFRFLARFSVAGDYQFQVTNPDGGVSDPQTLPVTETPQPTITGLAPSTLLVDSAEQTVTVLGSGFRTGLSAYVSVPGGGNDFAQNQRVTNLTANQFDMHLVLDHVGQYTLWVTDPDGAQSKLFTFPVKRSQAAVELTAIDPASPVVSADLQTLTVTGSGFQSRLIATLTNPSAGTTVLVGAGYVRKVTPTSFQLITTLSEPGTYTLKVTNPDGGQSSQLSFQAGNTGGVPEITGALPAPVVASPQSVTLTLLGSNLDYVAYLTVLRPDGGISYLAGSQLPGATSTSFDIVYSFTTPGNYTFQVENAYGSRSKSFVLTVPASSTAPVISAYSPFVFQQTAQLQTVTVVGFNFVPGLKAVWTTPSGATWPAPAIDPAGVLATRFEVSGSFADAGAYLLQVINPDGSTSDYFPIRIVTPSPTNPKILSHSPQPIAASASVRSLIVQGGDFLSGLSATLTLPDTTVVTYTPDQVQGVTFSSFVIAAAFPQAGAYTIQIQNPEGSLSNIYTFTVDPPAASPTITSIWPTPVHAALAGQTVTVNGSGFLAGPTVHVTLHPASGSASTITLDPSQVRYLGDTMLLITVSFSQAVTYDIQVDNPNGTQSNIFSFTVLPAVSAPRILGHVAIPNFQLLGQDFLTGMSVSIQPPSNGAYVLTGLTPTCGYDASDTSLCYVTLPLTLSSSGTYRMNVLNPDGGYSPTYEIAVP